MSSRTGPEEGLREARAPRLSPGVAASSRCSLGGRSIPTLIHSVRGERHGSRREGNAKQCRQDGHEKRRGPPSWSLLVSRLLLFLRGQLVDPLFVHHRACQTVALEYCLLVVPYAAQPAAGSHRRRRRPVGVSAPSGASESGSTGDSGGKLREVCGARAQGVDARQTETAVLPRDSINQQTSPHQHPGGRRGATPTTLRLLFHNTGTRTWVVYVGIAVLSLPGVLFGSWPNGGLLPSFRGSFSSSEAPGDEAAASSLTLVAAMLVLYTTVGAVLVGLCLAASAAAISAPFALGAWGRQLVLRRWRKVASLLVLQQKYMREVIRWTQEVAVTHRGFEGGHLSLLRKPAEAAASSPERARRSSPTMAASAVTADVRREFVQTCLLTKAGLAAATRSLLHGLSWRQIVRETKRDLGRALGLRAKEPTDSAASCAAAPAVLSTSGAGALGGASAPTGADSPSLLSLKEVAATVWSAERDLCAALQTVLLQLIAMTLSRASEPAFTASDSNEWTCVRVQGGQDAAAAADRFAVRSSRDGQSEWTEQDRAPLGFAASNTSAAVRFTFLSLPRQAPRGSAAWDGPETGPLSHSRQWRAGELKNLRSATLTSRHPAARAPAAPASLFQELLEASQTPAGEAGGEAPFLPQNRRESPENICAPSGEEVRSDVEVGPATEEHRMEHERRGGKDCKHSDAGGEGPCGRQLIAETPVEPCEVPRLLLPPGSAPARPAWLRCPVRSRRVAATDTQPQRSSDPRTAAALSRASDQLAESLAAAFNWVVAWFARLLHALECFGSLSAAAWSAARQLVAVGLTLGMAERELESSVGRLRMALLFEWTRLSAAGVRPPTHLFPSLHAPAAAAASGASFPSVASSFAPASSSSASGRPTAVGPSCEGAGGASRGAKLAAVLPCALRPPAVSPLFRESSSLQSPGDLRLGLGRLNQHVAAALALLRLGPELSASSSSFLPPLPLSAAEGGRGEEATGLAFAQRHLCPRCRANDSKKDAEGLLARRCADLDKFRQLGLAEGRVGPNNEGDGTRNEGDTLDDGAADEEWITVLQATQQQLGFARQSCDRALGLFVKRAQARRGQERDAAADPTGEAAEARAGETASSGDNGGRHGTPGEPRDAPARLAALPAPPQEFLEIYKGLGEEASRPGSAAGSLLLFSDDVDEATLAKGRAAMSELKRVFLSHPRMQRQRQQKRVVKELVPTGATPGGSSAQRRPGAGAAACHDRERARCGLNATAADEDGGPRLRLEVREEEGEEDEGRMQNAYWRRVGGAGPGGLPEPCEGSHSEAPGGDSNAAARWRDEDEREGRDRPRPTEDDVGPTESDSAGVRPSSSSSPAPRVSHPGEMAVRRSAPSTDTGSGASVRCLLSGVGLGITTPEALRLESRRQREAEKPPGTQSLFAELAGQFSRARASVAETSEGGTPQSRPADGTEIAGRLADVGEVSGQQRVWGGAFGLMQTNHFLMASAGGSRETGAVSFPAVFAHLAKGESGEEAFCGLGEAEDEEEEDDAEPPGLSHGEGFGGREASEESVSRDLGERESRSEGESVRHGGHHCGSDWGGGAWCLEGRSDDEETKMDAEARQD